MTKKIITILFGLAAGVILGFYLILKTNILAINSGDSNAEILVKQQVKPSDKKIVIGFLPFWLIDKAQNDYSPYITQISYFNLVIDSDGTIQKFTAPGEGDPGWHSLFTGKVDDYLAQAQSQGINLSLTIFSGNDKKIDAFLENPAQSAENLTRDISPVMAQYGFSDLNLDIEMVGDATPDQRTKYTRFVEEVRTRLDSNITLTIDAPGIAFVKDKNLTDPKSLAKSVDYIVLMGYDFHNPGSNVTGPVAPQSGAGVVSEFDIESAVQAATFLVSKHKLVLAIPLYGYSWETINSSARSATLPGSAYSISSRSIEELLSTCTNCKTEFDKTDQETHTIYKDEDVEVYHQVFYPDKVSTQIKVDFAKSQNLGGMAVWALGYEGSTIMDPLKSYLNK